MYDQDLLVQKIYCVNPLKVDKTDYHNASQYSLKSQRKALKMTFLIHFLKFTYGKVMSRVYLPIGKDHLTLHYGLLSSTFKSPAQHRLFLSALSLLPLPLKVNPYLHIHLSWLLLFLPSRS